MKAVILAGGRGTRLWPLSRKNYPKQFLKIGGDVSLLQATVRRLLNVVGPEDIIVMTNADYEFHVRADLVEYLGEDVGDRIVLEPCSRNTAPALALAAAFCTETLDCGSDEVMFVSPSDHVIRPDDRFCEFIRQAEAAAGEGHIVTFGIQPTGPETGYGYIKAAKGAGRGCLPVERFAEKPDRETAQEYVDSGDYYWNSGMFAFKASVFTEEIRRHAPEISAIIENGYAGALKRFGEMPDISVDYAVMERSDRVVTLPMDIYWNDVGSWDSFFECADRDERGNLNIGDVLPLETNDSLIMSDGRLIATVGLSDLLVVETDDAILITKRGDAQKVKDVVDRLKVQERREAIEHLTTYRPWGNYTVLERGHRYQIKRIVVNPGEKLSLQMHHHRSEHWVVIRGTALVTRGEDQIHVHENESVYIPKSTRHRLENPGKISLEIIEVQNGEYVEEDDIVRFDDIYGREDSVG